MQKLVMTQMKQRLWDIGLISNRKYNIIKQTKFYKFIIFEGENNKWIIPTSFLQQSP